MSSTVIRKLYAYRALDDFVLIYPLYNVMFASRGISTFQISSLLIIWSATSLIVNIPAGVLADRYSRKNLLFYGQLIRALGYVVWLVSPDYVGYAVGFILWAIGGDFSSGTFQALIFDELKAQKQERHYSKVRGRAESIALTATVIATSIAAAAVLLGYNFVLSLSIVAVILSGLVAYSIPNAKRQGTIGDASFVSDLAVGIKEAVTHPEILQLVLLGGFIGTIFGTMEEFFPLLFKAYHFSVPIIPLLEAAAFSAATLGGIVAYRFERLRTSFYMFMVAATGLALALAATTPRLIGVGFIIIFAFASKALEIVYDAKLQHAMSGDLRATVTSVSEFAVEVFGIVMYLIVGFVSDQYGLFVAFEAIGALVVVVALGYVFAPLRMLRSKKA